MAPRCGGSNVATAHACIAFVFCWNDQSATSMWAIHHLEQATMDRARVLVMRLTARINRIEQRFAAAVQLDEPLSPILKERMDAIVARMVAQPEHYADEHRFIEQMRSRQ